MKKERAFPVCLWRRKQKEGEFVLIRYMFVVLLKHLFPENISYSSSSLLSNCLPFVKRVLHISQLSFVLLLLRCYVAFCVSACKWEEGRQDRTKWSRRQYDIVVVSTVGPAAYSLINHMKRYTSNVQLAAVEPGIYFEKHKLRHYGATRATRSLML